MTFPSYSTGTVSVSANGTVVTGSGPVWSGVNARPGDVLQIGAFQTIISDVTDVTHLVIPTWGGGAQSGVAYTIYQSSPLRFSGGPAMADVSSLISTLSGRTFYTVIGASPTADGLTASEGQYALKTNTTRWQAWLWTSGAWVLQGSPVGVSYRSDVNGGLWLSSATYAVGDMVSRSGTLYISNTASNVGNAPESSPTQWNVASAAGMNGATITTGTGVPSGGTDGDLYIRTTTYDLYKRAAGTWTIIGNIFGATGATGATPIINATSNSAVTVGTGNQTFTIQSGCAFGVGQRLRVANAALSRMMDGPVVSYSGTTLVIAVDDTLGSGADSTWNISISGEKGQAGFAGPQGAASSVPGPVGPTSTVPGPQGIQGVAGNGLAYNASGRLTDRTTYDSQAQGYAFLETDVAPFRLWIKASNTTADWAGPTYIGGAAAIGDLGSVADSVLTIFDYGVAA